MNLFYAPDVSGNVHLFDEEESKHIIRVLRFKMGDVIFLTNGKGDFFKAEIVSDHPKSCSVRIVETTHGKGKRNYSVHLAISPTKNMERFEWFLEKATEIGIDEITPLICEHSERREINRERLNKVIVAAMKQSLKSYLPVLHDSISFSAFITKKFSAQKFICSVDAAKDQLLKKLCPVSQDVLILIGPEGDFSPEEIALAEKNEFRKVSLGESRLRTETAGIVACDTVYFLNQ